MDRIDDAAVGAIYGAVTILGLIVVLSPSHTDPLITAGSMFATVLAVALTEAFAQVSSKALKSGEQIGLSQLKSAWLSSRTILLTANGPTLALLLCAAGFYNVFTAILAAQILAISLLFFYGGRVGFRVRGTVFSTFTGAGVTGAIGIALSFVKNILH
ncbi:MAG: hypothetical protein GY952_12715 [Rhodobacteraceae bacterium]|nr:hypothetical protein [Paracoccaceae bacterium]